MRRTVTALGTGAVIALCALTACTVPATTDPAASAPELTATQQDRIERAEEQLVQTCMTGHGFRYWPEPPAGDAEEHGTDFVLDDIARARAQGYGSRVQRGLLARRQRGPNATYRESLSARDRARYSATLAGDPADGALTAELPTGGTLVTPRGGCRATAQQELYGDRAAWFRANGIAMNLTPLWVPALVEDPRFTEALTAWSACMRGKGHSFADPRAVRTALPRLTEGQREAKAYATEVRLAVAEATCARDSALADTARALKPVYVARARARYGEELALHGRLQRAALARAEDLIGRD
ncbi:hypothetical protein ACIQNG_08480 [Streptomyces sp. NPDC091377]|uniref:hypothetical protein n=1 Tax=Streptomyces sp. NPDC091377 TaxID=3365995 RepID=UPI0038035709